MNEIASTLGKCIELMRRIPRVDSEFGKRARRGSEFLTMLDPDAYN